MSNDIHLLDVLIQVIILLSANINTVDLEGSNNSLTFHSTLLGKVKKRYKFLCINQKKRKKVKFCCVEQTSTNLVEKVLNMHFTKQSSKKLNVI